MSAKTMNKKKVGQVVLYVVVLLLLIGCVGFFAVFTNGFTGDFTSFYVVCNDKTVMDSDNGFVLSSNEPLKVDVCYTFGFMSEEISGYSLSVLPLEDFAFTVDGEAHSFLNETNVIDGFNITYEENNFTIVPKGDLHKILQEMYPDSEVVVDRSLIDFSKDLVRIVISSSDGSAKVSMNCKIDNDVVYGVTLDQEEIVF